MKEKVKQMALILTKDDLSELEILLNELPPLERRFLIGLLEHLTPEEVWAFLDTMDADIEDIPCCHFVDPSPYFEGEPVSTDKREIQFDAQGRICVRNESSCWLPELTLQREIGGTVYSVFASYDGMESLDRKLLRILAQNAENSEDHP